MIQFGTDGWRGIIARDVTFANMRLVAQAIADYVKNDGGKAERGLVVGYDTRFLSDRFARECAAVFAANDIKVFLADGFSPTPAVSWAVRDLNAAGGVMVTASHNPPVYNGIKFKASHGGSAAPEIMQGIEQCLRKIETRGEHPKTVNLEKAVSEGMIRYYSPRAAHLRHILRIINPEAIRKVRGKVIANPMFGAARGYYREILGEMGIEGEEICAEDNPGFGGINPEPIEKNLEPLRRAVLARGAVVGLATDGDGDRIGAIDASGTFINSHQIFALLIQYLVEQRGWRGGVAKTCTVSGLVNRVAEKYGLSTYQTPVGFKYICDLMLREDILIGGEESGGIGIKHYIPERDGVMLGMLLLEIIGAYGKPLAEILNETMREVGYYYFERVDLGIDTDTKDALMRFLRQNTAREFGGQRVLERDTTDGVKLLLEKGWIMFRPSGTEPIVRVYVESDSPLAVQQILDQGKRLVEQISAACAGKSSAVGNQR